MFKKKKKKVINMSLIKTHEYKHNINTVTEFIEYIIEQNCMLCFFTTIKATAYRFVKQEQIQKSPSKNIMDCSSFRQEGSAGMKEISS